VRDIINVLVNNARIPILVLPSRKEINSTNLLP
jgi:hypothetical protein